MKFTIWTNHHLFQCCKRFGLFFEFGFRVPFVLVVFCILHIQKNIIFCNFISVPSYVVWGDRARKTADELKKKLNVCVLLTDLFGTKNLIHFFLSPFHRMLVGCLHHHGVDYNLSICACVCVCCRIKMYLYFSL